MHSRTAAAMAVKVSPASGEMAPRGKEAQRIRTEASDPEYVKCAVSFTYSTHAHIHAHTHAHTLSHTRAHARAHTHTHVHTHTTYSTIQDTHTCTRTQHTAPYKIHTHVHSHTYTSPCIQMHTHQNMYAYMRTYLHNTRVQSRGSTRKESRCVAKISLS